MYLIDVPLDILLEILSYNPYELSSTLRKTCKKLRTLLGQQAVIPRLVRLKYPCLDIQQIPEVEMRKIFITTKSSSKKMMIGSVYESSNTALTEYQLSNRVAKVCPNFFISSKGKIMDIGEKSAEIIEITRPYQFIDINGDGRQNIAITKLGKLIISIKCEKEGKIIPIDITAKTRHCNISGVKGRLVTYSEGIYHIVSKKNELYSAVVTRSSSVYTAKLSPINHDCGLITFIDSCGDYLFIVNWIGELFIMKTSRGSVAKVAERVKKVAVVDQGLLIILRLDGTVGRYHFSSPSLPSLPPSDLGEELESLIHIKDICSSLTRVALLTITGDVYCYNEKTGITKKLNDLSLVSGIGWNHDRLCAIKA